MNKLTIKIEGILGLIPLLSMVKNSEEEIELTFVSSKLTPNHAHDLRLLLDADEPVTARISGAAYNSFKFNIRCLVNISNLDGLGKCIRLIADLIPIEHKEKPELPPNLSVVEGSGFHLYMLSHNMTAGECYQNWITDYAWTDKYLVASGYMTENVLVPIDSRNSIKEFKAVGWTDEQLVGMEIASWQPVEKPAYESMITGVKVTFNDESIDEEAVNAAAKSIEDWADSHSYFTAGLPDSFKELFPECKPFNYETAFKKAAQLGNTNLMLSQAIRADKLNNPTVNVFTNTKLGQTWEEPNSIEFTDIQDNLDFMELVDKFHAEYRLKGGQKSDGTWFLSGTKL